MSDDQKHELKARASISASQNLNFISGFLNKNLKNVMFLTRIFLKIDKFLKIGL